MSDLDRLIHYQGDVIELTLHACNLPVRVVGGVIAHRFARHEIRLPLDRRPEDVIRQQQNLSARLGVACTVHMHAGALVVDVPLNAARAVPFAGLMRQSTMDPLVALLGEDAEGHGLKLRLNSPDVAHILAAGTTGSGKTALVQAMLASLALATPPRQVEFVIIDPQGRSYLDFAAYPHLAYNVVVDVDEAIYVLEQLVQDGKDRERAGQLYPWRVIVLEELADLIAAAGKQVIGLVARLTQRGRHAGYTVVGCAQKPTVDAIGSLVKANFPTRLVGAVTSPDEARLASGRPGSGAETLLGRGDFILVARGELIRFQAAYITPQEVRDIGRRLSEAYPRYADHRRDPIPPPGWVPRVIPGGRKGREARILADARRLLADPGWTAAHIQGGELVGEWQSAAGLLLDRPNSGGHHLHIKDVGQKALEIFLAGAAAGRAK